MLKVCPSCQGIYELKEGTCPTCQAKLVPRKGNEAAARPSYVRPEPVTYWDGVLLLFVAGLYLAGERSIWMAIIVYSVLSRLRENGVWNKKKF